MASVDLDLNGISNLTGLLRRLPLGEETRALLQRIAAWNTRGHEDAVARVKRFDAKFSELTDDQLSDEFAHWTSELMRLHELCGLFDGQRKLLELQSKRARAAARSTIRATHEARMSEEAAKEKGEKLSKLTAAEVNDRAEDDPEVTKADGDLVMIDVVVAGVHAYRESCATAVQGLSREISFRQAQFNARVRG